MTYTEDKIRAIVQPVKLKYHARSTEEFAERAYEYVHYLARHNLELLSKINELERRICALDKPQYRDPD